MACTDEGINGHPSALATERAIEELRRGRAIQLRLDGESLLVAAVEMLDAALLERLQRVGEATLYITAQRARAAGLMRGARGPVALTAPQPMPLDTLQAAAGLGPDRPQLQTLVSVTSVRDAAGIEAGFRLAKLGRLLPALLAVPTDSAEHPGLLQLSLGDLAEPTQTAEHPVELVSRARVPLVDALDCEIVLFRRRGDSTQHLAIVIGEPSLDAEVPVRLHSSCMTGDVLGSLRCDCGEQLKRAIGRIGALGGGVLLYLDQEGRGIGLANKLRAYALQDAGLDTLDADQHLGFHPDERDYAVAAAALRELGVRRIRLLTNNPAKISALEQHGIEVAGRLPLVAAVNAYNQRYLKAKLDRAGHLAE